MSVDYYSCSKCGESRYSECVGTCGGERGPNGCLKRLCTSCLVNNDIGDQYAYPYGVKFDGSKKQIEEYGITNPDAYSIGDIIDDSGIDPKYCPYCSGKEIHESDVLQWLLDKTGMTISDVKEEIEKCNHGKS